MNLRFGTVIEADIPPAKFMAICPAVISSRVPLPPGLSFSNDQTWWAVVLRDDDTESGWVPGQIITLSDMDHGLRIIDEEAE